LQRGEKNKLVTRVSSLPPLIPLPADALIMGFGSLPENFTNITNTLADRPSIATLATVLLSFAGIQDWLKLFLIGGVLETCRRTALQAWQNLLDSIWITVDFEDGDDSYGGSLHSSPGATRDHSGCVLRPHQALTKM
jgi:hypothetical protein